MPKKKFTTISSIITDAKKGKMFILVDDKNRENEGDLVIPGSKCNSKSINFSGNIMYRPMPLASIMVWGYSWNSTISDEGEADLRRYVDMGTIIFY